MSLAAALLASLLAAAPAPAAKKPPPRPRCSKHIVVTFAVYHSLPRAEVATNGCWTPEFTVQDRERFNLCHDRQAPPAGVKPVSIYDDVNLAGHHGRDAREAAACARHGTEYWEYLTPPYPRNILAEHNLKRLYAELYNSTSGPAQFLSSWSVRMAGHTVWPMIDASLRHSAASVTAAIRGACARIGDHSVLGIYANSDVTNANGRLPLIERALNACTEAHR